LFYQYDLLHGKYTFRAKISSTTLLLFPKKFNYLDSVAVRWDRAGSRTLGQIGKRKIMVAAQ
jgi:hypothetical protein